MTENRIEIIEYDSKTGKVFFKHNSDVDRNVKVYLSWNGLTIYYTEMTLGTDSSVIYYVGFNKSNIEVEFKLKVSFEFEDYERQDFYFGEDGETVLNHIRYYSTIPTDPSFYSFNEVFFQKIYDHKLVRINKDDIVVDIGANYGFFAGYAQTHLPSKIFCIEPSTRIMAYLRNNLGNNRTRIIEAAVSSSTGVQRFSDNITSSASGHIDENGEYEVRVIGINDIFDELKIEKINFLKIDCEGSEKNIFEEISQDTLNKIDKIVVEYHSDEIKDIILAKLLQCGFEINDVKSSLIFAHNPEFLKNKKKIALVSTYCDTQEKKDIFLNLVKKVKSFGVDVIAISPLPLDKEHIEACDYIYFTKENPILYWPTRLFTFWRNIPLYDGKFLTMQRGVGDYSWAALYHVKKLTQIAMDYDYDIFYHMIYDLEIDDVVERALKKFEGNIVYPRRDPHNPETLWETTLHFMSFDRGLMEKIEKEITLEQYLSTNGVAEGEVFKWKNKFNISGSEHPVRDLIYYWKDYDFFDYSPNPDFKVFFSRNDEMDIWLGENPVYRSKLPSNLRMVFYDFSGSDEFSVIINGEERLINPKPYEFVEFDINSKSITSLIIKYQNKEYDLSEQYTSISMNQVYVNHRP